MATHGGGFLTRGGLVTWSWAESVDELWDLGAESLRRLRHGRLRHAPHCSDHAEINTSSGAIGHCCHPASALRLSYELQRQTAS